jgi:hypothetical protein
MRHLLPLLAALALCALKQDGSVWCWGYGRVLPFFFRDMIWTPTQVPGLVGVKRLEGSLDYTCAVLADDQRRCWGELPMPLASEL